MDIRRMLKDDGARFRNLRPPADMRQVLRASLDNVPPAPVRSRNRPFRWFAPAVAMLTLAMLLVVGQPWLQDPGLERSIPEVVTSEHPFSERIQQDNANLTREPVPGDLSRVQAAVPVARPVLFSLLATANGLVLGSGLRGRRRMMALVVLVAATTLGLVLIL